MASRKIGVIAIFVGLIGFMIISRNPRFAAFHTVDILQLVASGMCFGVGLVSIFGRLKPRERR